MSSATPIDETPVQRSGKSTPEPLSKIVDWAVAALLVFGGFVFVTLGIVLYSAADLTFVADLVADGTLQSTELTDAELIDVTYGLLWYTGLGLAVTGLLLLGSGIAYLIYRSRVRRERAATGVTGPDTTTNAIVGAVASVVLSFVPFAPVLGGIVSGYLQGGNGRDGVRVGAYAGLVASVPIGVLFAFLVGGAVIVGGELSVGFVGGVVALTLVFAFVVSVAYLVALSALGGYLGNRLADRETPA